MSLPNPPPISPTVSWHFRLFRFQAVLLSPSAISRDDHRLGRLCFEHSVWNSVDRSKRLIQTTVPPVLKSQLSQPPSASMSAATVLLDLTL